MRGCSFLLLALAAPCLAAPQAKETDPWLQVLNGGSSREVQEVQEAQERQDVQEEELVPQEVQPERQEPLQPAQPPPRPQPLAPRPRPQRPAPRPRPGQNQRFPGPRRRPSRRPAGPRRPGARPPAPAQDKGIVGNLVDGITGGIDSLTCAGQNWFSDEKLKDEEFIKFQLDCARGLGPCDDIGDKIKILAPEVLAGRCPRPCNECTRAQIQKVMTELSQKFPREFQEMINKGRRPG